jgi:putative transposase
MARLPRIDVVGIPQHIIVRGVDRQPCFFAHTDRALYLDILRDAAARHGAAIHAYTLMTNHVHLLATGGSPGALSSMMQLVGLRYVRRINGLYGRTGTLFEGRFRASLVQSERYFLSCLRYIELNPLRARMVELPMDYPWSSCRHHVGAERNDWLTPHEEYLRLGASDAARWHAYSELLATSIGDDEILRIRKHTNRNCALGDEPFQSRIAALLGRRVRIARSGRPWPARGGSPDSDAYPSGPTDRARSAPADKVT